MNDNFEDISSRLPDLNVALAQRIAAKAGNNSSLLHPPGNETDPYQLMLKRKQQTETGEVNLPPTVQWPEEDVKTLEDYCKRMGVIGFSSRLNPKLALAQLKQQCGDYSGVPLENRFPDGYEKAGNHSGHGPNYPYQSPKKQILHG